MLESVIDLLKMAEKDEYAVPAFNFHNLEILQAIIENAEVQHAPVILQITPIYLEKIGAIAAAAMAREVAKAAKIPVALHLDHCTSIKWINWALAQGFTSVMIDGSTLPLDENIALTRETSKAAHEVGASAEAELGHIGGVEDASEAEDNDINQGYANLSEAFILVQESGVDTLAPAVGTAHGLYKFTPNINFELIEKLKQTLGVPLVLHGGSGIPDEMIRKAISKGIRKANFGTELKVAWAESVTETIITEQEPWKVALKAREAIGRIINHKINLCGANKKA